MSIANLGREAVANAPKVGLRQVSFWTVTYIGAIPFAQEKNMDILTAWFRTLIDSEDGVTAIEYALIASAMVAVLVVAVAAVADALELRLGNVALLFPAF
jgi:Flp pilus assembly pilin Flp